MSGQDRHQRLIDIIIKANIKSFLSERENFENLTSATKLCPAIWLIDQYDDDYVLADHMHLSYDKWYKLVDARMDVHLKKLQISTHQRLLRTEGCFIEMLDRQSIVKLVSMTNIQYNPKVTRAIRRWAAINRLKRSPHVHAYVKRTLEKLWHPTGVLAQKGWKDMNTSQELSLHIF